MVPVVKWFENKKAFGFIEYKENGDVFVHASTKTHDESELLNSEDGVEFYLIKCNDGYKVEYVKIKKNGRIEYLDVKTNNKLKKILNKEKIELAAAIVTVFGFVFNFSNDKEPQTENNMNIDCQNCVVEIIEKDDNEIKITINERES